MSTTALTTVDMLYADLTPSHYTEGIRTVFVRIDRSHVLHDAQAGSQLPIADYSRKSNLKVAAQLLKLLKRTPLVGTRFTARDWLTARCRIRLYLQRRKWIARPGTTTLDAQ